MLKIEEDILSSLSHKDSLISHRQDVELEKIPLGGLSAEFYNDPIIKAYCGKAYALDFTLRIALEEYLTPNKSTESLENVRKAIINLCAPCRPLYGKGLQNKTAGTYLTPIPPELIRQVYEYEDAALTQLFGEYFPIPTAALFKNKIPQVIQEREVAALETIKKIPAHSFSTFKSFVKSSQRYYRMKQRKREEIARILLHHKQYLMLQHMSEEEWKKLETQITSKHALEQLGENDPLIIKIRQWADNLLQDANKPYRPMCNDPELSNRLTTAAQKVSAFSTAKHITSESALESIFNEALYGRRTLKNFYYPFVKASLWDCDILNGDADAVCLGPKKIDPKAGGSISIEFNLNKLTSNNPSAFYKQRDLEYSPDHTQTVQLGNETILFSNTTFVRENNPDNIMTHFQLFDRNKKISFTVALPKTSFIAYDFKKMHAILTLNFFRFIDKIPNKNFVANFYQKVNQLTDEQLVSFLTEIEKNMTTTAEVNFYGAHEIDFSSIISISEKYLQYTLNLAKFIKNLNQGAIDELREARQNIPNLFTSYRFLDYLLSQVQYPESRYYLDDLRKQCNTPKWVQYSPLSIPDGFEIIWTQATLSYRPR